MRQLRRFWLPFVLLVSGGLFSLSAQGAGCSPSTYTSPDTADGYFAQLKSTMDGTANCELMLNTSETPTLRIVGWVGDPYGGRKITGYAYLPGNVSMNLSNFRVNGTPVADSQTGYPTAFGNAYVVTGEYTHDSVTYSAQATLTYTATSNTGTVTFSDASVTIAGPPAVTSISPSSGPAAGGTDVTITGSRFTGATAVTIGGVSATSVTVVNDTTITARTPAGTAGAKDVVVTNSSGDGTGSGLFTYVAAPAVTSVSPSSGDVAGGTDITITGSDLTGATAVTIGGVSATNITVVNATTITARTPAGTAGAKNIVVTTPSGSGTGSGLYTYTAAAAPAITSISPSSGTIAGGTVVTISGTNFTGTSAVTIGGVAASGVTVVDANTVRATTPAGTTGAANVVITTSVGSASSAGLYTYVDANPAEDAQVIGLTDVQVDISRRFVGASTNSVINRLEWLRRNKAKANQTNFDALLAFASPDGAPAAAWRPSANFANEIVSGLLPAGWSMWAEANATRGSFTAGDGASSRVRSHDFSVGLDTKLDADSFLGAAVRIGANDVDVRSSDSEIDGDAYSGSIYFSTSLGEDSYLDVVAGLSRQEMDITRDNAGTLLTGSRTANQVFGAVALRKEVRRQSWVLEPYGRLDASFTKLSAYSESGGAGALRYEAQEIKNANLAAGLLARTEVATRAGTFKPYGRLEAGADVSPSSDAQMAYLADTRTRYTVVVADEADTNWRAGIGVDLEPKRGLILHADYERYQSSGVGHSDSIRLAAAYRPTGDVSYNLSAGAVAGNLQLGLGVKFANVAKSDFSARLTGTETAAHGLVPAVALEMVVPF